MFTAKVLLSWLSSLRPRPRRPLVKRPGLAVEQLERREVLSSNASLLAGLSSPGFWQFVTGVYEDRFGHAPTRGELMAFVAQAGSDSGPPSRHAAVERRLAPGVEGARRPAQRHSPRHHLRVLPALPPSAAGGQFFDLGGPGAPAAAGHTAVAPFAYNPALGYGWADPGAVRWTSRPAGNGREWDFVWGRDATFLADLPDGTYAVTPVLGDARAAHDLESIYLQGRLVSAGLTTAAGHFLTPTYQVTVSGGQLQFRIADLGGRSAYFALDGLMITPLALATPPVAGITPPVAGAGTSPPPVAGAGPGPSGREGSAVSFAGSAQGGTAPYSERWDFGDGTTTTGTLSPSHTYADNGTYMVTLTVTDALGRSSNGTTTANIVNVPPTATITGAPASATAGQVIALGSMVTDPSSADQAAGFTYAWSVTDNGAAYASGTASTFSFTPSAAGTYAVSLSAKDKDGGSGSATKTITVSPTPLQAGAGPSQSGKEGSAVSFAGSAQGGTAPYTETWDFGDGTTTTGTLTPSHTYTADGTYTVRLAVKDAAGATASATTTAAVAEAGPAVAITGAPSSATAGQAISLGSTVTDPDPAGQAVGFTYAWSVTDNGAAYASGTAATFSFTPTTAGTYVVTLAAKDNDSGSGSATKTITVSPAPLQAGAGPSQSGKEGSAVTFAGSAQGGTAPYSETWDFGDGTTTTGTLAPSHTYAADGTYTVRLTVKDAAGATTTSSTTATVAEAPPAVAITGAPSSATAGQVIALGSMVTDPSSADQAAGFTYAWSVTDNGAAYAAGTAATFSFTPSAAGTYVVTLAAADKDGGSGSATKTISVTSATTALSFTPLTPPWSWSSDSIQSTLTVGADVYFGMNKTGNIYHYNEITGWDTTVWSVPTPKVMAMVRLSSSVWVISAGQSPGHLYQFSPATGASVLSSTTSTLDFATLQVVQGKVLAFASWTGQVYQSADGLNYTLLSSPGNEGVWTSLVASDGKIYMGGEGIGTNEVAPLVSTDGGVTWKGVGVDLSNSKGNLLSLAQANNGDILIGKTADDEAVVQRLRPDGSIVDSAAGLPLFTFQGPMAVLSNNRVLMTLGRSGSTEPPYASYDDGNTWQVLNSGIPSTVNGGGWAVTPAHVYYYWDSGLYVSSY